MSVTFCTVAKCHIGGCQWYHWIGQTHVQLCPKYLFFFTFLFQHKISKLYWPIGVKFCTVICSRPTFIMPVQNFLGPFSKKILGAKNMQNLAQFQNNFRYSKSVMYLIYQDSSHVRCKMFGELWSTNVGGLEVESYPPKTTFGRPYFCPEGVLHTKIFRHTNDQEGSRIGLKFSKCVSLTLAVVSLAPRNFAT